MTARIPRYAEFQEGVDFTLPDLWAEQTLTVARKFARSVESPPDSSTSAARDQLIPLRYNVVDGDGVQRHLNWLNAIYQERFLELAQRAAGSANEIETAQNVTTGINLNIMKGSSDTYEWHYDSNPLTGLLFVTQHREGQGGELVFSLPGEDVSVQPTRGKLIFFDARNTPHYVRSLTSKRAIRVTVPMNYYLKGQRYNRPSDLDHHIFGGGR